MQYPYISENNYPAPVTIDPPVSRTVIQLPPDTLIDSTNSYYGDLGDPGVYEEYRLEARYTTNTGVCGMPPTAQNIQTWLIANQTVNGIGSNGNPGAATPPPYLSPTNSLYLTQTLPVKYQAEDTELELVFSCRSVGGRPRIPLRVSQDGNLFLKKEILDFPGVAFTVDGLSTINEVSGILIYGVKDPTSLNFTNPLFPYSLIPYFNFSDSKSLPSDFDWPVYDPLAVNAGVVNTNTTPALAPNGLDDPYVPGQYDYANSQAPYYYGVVSLGPNTFTGAIPGTITNQDP